MTEHTASTDCVEKRVLGTDENAPFASTATVPSTKPADTAGKAPALGCDREESSPAPNDNEDAEGEKTEAAVEANNDNGPIASTGTVSSRKPASTAGKAPALHSDDGEPCDDADDMILVPAADLEEFVDSCDVMERLHRRNIKRLKERLQARIAFHRSNSRR